MTCITSLNAQIYTQSGVISGSSTTNNVGIGTNAPAERVTIAGSHNDSRILLHSLGGSVDVRQADLVLWASEPEISYSGVGISNNALVSTGVGMHLLNPARGGSYIRLLDNAMMFNIMSSSGINKQALIINSDGNVGIGTTNPTSKLTVAGDINSREVRVTVNAGADFVFEKDYDLPSLDSVSNFIKENKHLPEIASAEEMKKDGINLSEMNIKLLQKIEELTIYVIQQQEDIEILKKNIKIKD